MSRVPWNVPALQPDGRGYCLMVLSRLLQNQPGCRQRRMVLFEGTFDIDKPTERVSQSFQLRAHNGNIFLYEVI